MSNNKKHTIDLSEYKVSSMPNLFNHKNNVIETNNKFGWNVSYAEVVVDNNQRVTEYRLLTKINTVRCHAKLIEAPEFSYWRFEFVGRNLNFSPDVFEPSLKDFLTFYYHELNKEPTHLDILLELPVVLYELYDNTSNSFPHFIRYAFSADRLYHKPVFVITIGSDRYLQAIADFQCEQPKNIAFPTPSLPEKYLLQDFAHNSYNLHDIKSKSEYALIFRGFCDYEVKYLADEGIEGKFKQYGFFPRELRKVVTEADLIFKFIPTVNLHLTKSCDMQCKHCFSDFSEISNVVDYDAAKAIVNEVSKMRMFKKINFSGGEPTLFKNMPKIVELAKKNGLETSMVSNGFNLITKPGLFNAFVGSLDLLALSIDGFDQNINFKIGRHVKKTTLSLYDYILLSQKCIENKIRIKINTVVTKINYDQILINDIFKLKPIRWKIIRMLPVKLQNDNANEILPSDSEFNNFIKINDKLLSHGHDSFEIVVEENEDVTGSYIMISPDGRFFNNVEGKHNYSESILKTGIENALKQTPLRRDVFFARKGNYKIL
jgi:radical S-adenosyl methionine domain-containing protein 2